MATAFRGGRAGALLVLNVGVAAMLVGIVPGVVRAAGGSLPFTSLQAGFSQELIGAVDHATLGGIAFASDGDPLVDGCSVSESPIYRFDLSGVTSVVHGSTIYPWKITAGQAGCGLTNHSNGGFYSNTNAGVVKLDETGALVDGPLLPSGSAEGIAVDPQTGDLAYVGIGGTIESANAALTATATLSTATLGDVIDGIVFDIAGNDLFLANQSTPSVTIVDRSGNLVQDVAVSSSPYGIAFFGVAPGFLLTNNTDGTMTRLDFPTGFANAPVQSAFSAGGFGGNLAQVGPDGCLYVTQAGTRYDDGTETDEDSLVRICGTGPPPTVATVTALSPVHAWIGLRNGDDQGTKFDIVAELLKNGSLVATGLTRCIGGIVRNPAAAKEALVSWDAFSTVPLAAGDVLSLRLSARIGTNPDGSRCGGHKGAVGLRLYYDASARPSRFDATITPDATADRFLHSNGTVCGSSASSGVTSTTIDTTAPVAGTARCVETSGLSFAGGNTLQVIGTWSMAALP